MTSSRLGQQLTLDFSAPPADTSQPGEPLAPSSVLGQISQPALPLNNAPEIPSNTSDAIVPQPDETLPAEAPPHIPIASTMSAESEPPRNQHNYRITPEDHLGSGSLKAKCYMSAYK